ncbi:MAG TPA: hypothetical protein VFN76_10065 [Candidatus Limnocylindria bacterium]|nr:hypothetical protein [Candidatus Limnocylindria bacterium]
MPRCSRTDPRTPCDARAEAQRAGEMFYSLHARGWIYPAADRKPIGGLPLFTWDACPFCGGPLPDVVDGFFAALRESVDALEIPPPATFTQDEEG